MDQFLLATPVVLWGGWPFFVRGWQSLVHRHLNMFTLIALGTGAAYAFSLVATLAPAFAGGFHQHGGMVPVYYEAAAVIVTLVLLGQVLEAASPQPDQHRHPQLAVASAPKTARLIQPDGREA